MSGRRLGYGRGVAAVAALAGVCVAPLVGQTRGAAPATSGSKAASWTPPRTPWGDPDISGSFTNKDEQGVPMAGARYVVKTAGGEELLGTLDDSGKARIDGIDPGSCVVKFPGHNDSWRPA